MIIHINNLTFLILFDYMHGFMILNKSTFQNREMFGPNAETSDEELGFL